MKKKMFISATAVAMSVAMATSAMAAPTARDNGNTDKSAGQVTSTAINANDASVLQKDDTLTVENGNFDGDWTTTSKKMSGNAQKIMNFILTPEKMQEKVGLRAYATNSSMTDGGFAVDSVVKIYDDLELDTTKKTWNGVYNNYEAPLTASTNHTIDATLAKSAELVDASSASIQEFGKFISGVAFQGFGKNAGKEVYLTSDDGWGVFAVAMRDVVPLSQEDFANSGYEGNIDKVFDGDFGVISAPYTNINDIADANLRARAEAFQALKAMIVTNKTHAEGVNDTNITSVAALYNTFKQAFPSNITESEFAKTVDHFGEVYTRRYNVGIVDKDGEEIIDGNINGDNTSGLVQKLINNNIYNYETATIQDVRNAFGDKIELSTTKDGAKTWGFTVEVYTRYENK